MWHSLVVRLVRDQEVASSSLVTPTNKKDGISRLFFVGRKGRSVPCDFLCVLNQEVLSVAYFSSPLWYIYASLLAAMYPAENLHRHSRCRISGAYVRMIGIWLSVAYIDTRPQPHPPFFVWRKICSPSKGPRATSTTAPKRRWRECEEWKIKECRKGACRPTETTMILIGPRKSSSLVTPTKNPHS